MINSEKIDYKKILLQYIDYVGLVEGTDFLGSGDSHTSLCYELTEEEDQALLELRDISRGKD